MQLVIEMTISVIVCFFGFLLLLSLFGRAYRALKKAEREDRSDACEKQESDINEIEKERTDGPGNR